MGRSPVVVRAPSPWKFRIPPAIPGGTLLNPTAPEEQGLAALREGDKSESRANGKEPMNFKPLTTTTMPTTSTPTALAPTTSYQKPTVAISLSIFCFHTGDIMTALKPTDIDDLTAFGAGTHLLKTLILELLLVWGGTELN